VSDVSDDPDGIIACRAQRPLSMKHPEFALSVAVVDTLVLRARETTARGVYSYTTLVPVFTIVNLVSAPIMP
jgi:hypothetical protein